MLFVHHLKRPNTVLAFLLHFYNCVLASNCVLAWSFVWSLRVLKACWSMLVCSSIAVRMDRICVLELGNDSVAAHNHPMVNAGLSSIGYCYRHLLSMSATVL